MTSGTVLLLLPALFHSFKACPSIRFVTDEGLAGKTSELDLIGNETFELRPECAVKCVRTTGCKSIFYDQTSRTCRLHSKYFKDSDGGLVPNAGYKYLELVCPGIDPAPTVTRGVVQLFIEGALATLKMVCEYRYSFSGPATATCFEDVDWTARGTCVENRWFNLTTPFIKYFDPVKPRVGSKITLVGRAGSNRFIVIVKQSRNVTLQLVANAIPGQIILQKKYNVWGHKVTDTTAAMSPSGAVFTLTLEFASQTELKGTIIGNSSYYNFTYPVLVPPESLSLVQVQEDVFVEELHIQWP